MKYVRSLILALAAVGLLAAPARAQALKGNVSSVDADAKKLVVTETGTGKDVNVAVNDGTVIRSASGKVLKLDDLKAGDGVGIAHVAGVATEIVVNVKPEELTGHVKSVAANLKTLVVTETATRKDYTIGVDPRTTITTSGGKKLKISDLKKGDGVGIAHAGGLASKIVVNVKPGD